jgi:hypothetical protein
MFQSWTSNIGKMLLKDSCQMMYRVSGKYATDINLACLAGESVDIGFFDYRRNLVQILANARHPTPVCNIWLDLYLFFFLILILWAN